MVLITPPIQVTYLRSIFLSVLLLLLKSMKVTMSMCWMKLRVTSSSIRCSLT